MEGELTPEPSPLGGTVHDVLRLSAKAPWALARFFFTES